MAGSKLARRRPSSGRPRPSRGSGCARPELIRSQAAPLAIGIRWDRRAVACLDAADLSWSARSGASAVAM